MSIYCFRCEKESDYCGTNYQFITCPRCQSDSVVYLGEEPSADINSPNRVIRIMEKLEAIWWDNQDLHFSELLESVLGTRFSRTPDEDLEQALDDFLWS